MTKKEKQYQLQLQQEREEYQYQLQLQQEREFEADKLMVRNSVNRYLLDRLGTTMNGRRIYYHDFYMNMQRSEPYYLPYVRFYFKQLLDDGYILHNQGIITLLKDNFPTYFERKYKIKNLLEEDEHIKKI